MKFSQLYHENKYLGLLDDCIVTRGNAYRLKKAMEKPSIRLACLGGSIARGYCDSITYIDNPFPVQVGEYLTEKFVPTTVTNLAFPGTSSVFGMYMTLDRLEKDCPDIILLEYALNEGKSIKALEMLESLIIRLLSLPSLPAVIIVSAVAKDGYSAQDCMDNLAKHYQLAHIGLAEAFYDEIRKGKLPWELYSIDDVHSTEAGHTFIADCINKYIAGAHGNGDTYTELPEKPLYGNGFEKLRIMSFDEHMLAENGFKQSFTQHNLFCIEGGDDALLHFETEAKAVIIFFTVTNDHKLGTANVFCDGKLKSMLMGYSIFGWGYPAPSTVFESDVPQKHCFEVRLSEYDRGKSFQINAVLYTE